jgi:hypothetical protein
MMIRQSVRPQQGNILDGVRRGTPVYDRQEKLIGAVRRVQYGDISLADLPLWPDEIYRASIPAQARLKRQGYMQIDTGFLSRDRVVTPDQIAELHDDHVRLNVDDTDLIKL